MKNAQNYSNYTKSTVEEKRPTVLVSVLDNFIQQSVPFSLSFLSMNLAGLVGLKDFDNCKNRSKDIKTLNTHFYGKKDEKSFFTSIVASNNCSDLLFLCLP